MATLTATLVRCSTKDIPKSKRKLQKHLRSAGLAYISRTGKIVPAKQVAEELCQCPHKCEERVSREARERLFNHFYGLGDPDLQNAFLRAHMDVRARPVVLEPTASGRQPRRITCKYLVPLLPGHEKADVCQKAFVSAFVITTKRVRLQREKLIASLGLNVYSHTKHLLNQPPQHHHLLHHQQSPSRLPIMPIVPTPPLLPSEDDDDYHYRHRHRMMMDVDGVSVTDKRLSDSSLSPSSSSTSAVREKLKQKKPRPVDDPLVPLGLWLPDGVTIAPVTVSPDHDRDIAIVNNFFYNQLWKPEYIGIYS